MKSRINKFVVSPNKPELILFLGDRYLKYFEANFTNKIIKENLMNIIPMKIEKESNFIDMDFIPKIGGGFGEMFVIITDTNNSIFVYEKTQIRHKLFNQLLKNPSK